MFAESWISDVAVTCGISQKQVCIRTLFYQRCCMVKQISYPIRMQMWQLILLKMARYGIR